MTQWSLPRACKAMEQVFQEWTLPKRIKIDNGLPFVNSKACNNPIKLFGQYFPVDSKQKGQQVSIVLGPVINDWIIALASDDGTQVKMIPNAIFTQENISKGIGFDD